MQISRLPFIIQNLLQQSKQIVSVHLVVGELIRFDEDQWRELIRGTPLVSCIAHIRLVRAELQCMACFQKYHPENLEPRCLFCGGVGAKILAGEEFYLESIEEENE